MWAMCKKMARIQDAGYWILDAGYWMQDTRYRIQDIGYKIQDTGCRIQDIGVTDYELFEFLTSLPDIDEVTF